MHEDSTPEVEPQRVARIVRKFRVGEEPSDFAYWQTQPYARRLAALEEIRREYIIWKYGSELGFQRVYSNY